MNYAELLKEPGGVAANKGGEGNGPLRPYAFRIYLTEGSGVVLGECSCISLRLKSKLFLWFTGANFMNGHNVVFDQDGMRIGFADSSCNYAPQPPQLSIARAKQDVATFPVSKGSGNVEATAGAWVESAKEFASSLPGVEIPPPSLFQFLIATHQGCRGPKKCSLNQIPSSLIQAETKEITNPPR